MQEPDSTPSAAPDPGPTPTLTPTPTPTLTPTPPAPKTAPWTALTLTALAIGVSLARRGEGEVAEWLRDNLSLSGVTADLEDQAETILLVPLGAVFVVFTRLTLGLRMLGPVRPILIALALHVTGIPIGVTFTLLVIVAIALMRPRLHGRGLPYFSRISLLLVAVAGIQLSLLIVANVNGWEEVQRAAFLPIVVLCLAGDGLYRVYVTDGKRAAARRVTTTLAVALLIEAVWSLRWIRDLLYEFPELILVEVAIILLISRYFDLRLLAPPGGDDNGGDPAAA